MTPINYREPQERNPDWFNHTSLKLKGPGSKVRLKLLGGEVGTDNYGKEAYMFEVMLENGDKRTWTVDTAHHLGDAMSASNMQTNDVFVIEYMGETMKTQHGMKSKYEIIKETGTGSAKPKETEDVAKVAEEVFAEDATPQEGEQEDPGEEVRIEDMDAF